jgi:hypothetical protein
VDRRPGWHTRQQVAAALDAGLGLLGWQLVPGQLRALYAVTVVGLAILSASGGKERASPEITEGNLVKKVFDASI